MYSPFLQANTKRILPQCVQFSQLVVKKMLVSEGIKRSELSREDFTKRGRKLSKSLGNVVDPLDTISEFGTDALRFTLSLGTAGQYLNLSTKRLTANKAFTNKLWNAGKFLLQNLPNQSDTASWDDILSHKFEQEEDLLKLPLAECWVISKLHMLVDEVTAGYDKFFFNDVAREIYDFFWGDFADWYIEAGKARLYQSGGHLAASAQAVLLYVFETM